jgi:ferredoxin
VRVDGAANALSALQPVEAQMLRHLRAGDGIRLACQAKVLHGATLTIERLVPAEVAEPAARGTWLPADQAEALP